jgi:RNA polymerase sigma factor (sigma-70 family)
MLTMNDPAVRASPPVPEGKAGSASSGANRAGSRSLTGGAARTDTTQPGDLERLVAAHAPQVTRLVRRLLGWRGEVDDVVQDVFVAAIKGLPRFDGRSSELTWLTRIAINCCRSHQRRVALRRWLPLRLLGEGPAATTDPAGQLKDQETQQQVRRAIGELAARDREVIVLRYLEELSVEEIAQVCHASRGSVEVRLSRARNKLEAILKPLIER